MIIFGGLSIRNSWSRLANSCSTHLTDSSSTTLAAICRFSANSTELDRQLIPFKITVSRLHEQCRNNPTGLFTNYVDNFFDHLPPSVAIFYIMNVDKNSTFLDLLPSSCKRWLTQIFKWQLLKMVIKHKSKVGYLIFF